ncbi:cholinephosphotransferase [Rhizoctonia solani AG-1 IA]|uniref:Cholinephosphotransferase n=1 Tax=Thanatephorus cucumeris (strain AG1-IA) TaxID=983506 RepID=L8WSU5_THACA|nr:cholinephosphotransferase [Rhizoctonia solani AG-1 IA]
MGLFEGYVPEHALENLKKYKYSGVDKSLLSNYVLNPFWNQFVKICLARSDMGFFLGKITFLGLCLVLTNFATLLYYDAAYLTEKAGASGPPQWVYFTWAAGLFWYQSFDAIDGKQARRTGMAGPLGQMFDHGCDALNTTLEVILACRALNLGRSWWPISSQIATLANFYLTTWEEFHTGTLYLGYFSGPVEGIIMIVGLYILTGTYGQSVPNLEWAWRLVGDLKVNETLMVLGAVGLIGNIAASYMNVLKSCRKNNESPITPLVRLIPFIVSTALHILWLAAPLTPSSHLTSNPITPADSTVDPHKGFTAVQIAPGKDLLLHSPAFVPFLCMWGLQFAHQVGRIILAHVTHQPFPMFDAGWIWATISLVDAWSWRLFGRAPVLHSNPLLFILISLGASFLAYGRFCIAVINDITNYLGIACFTVRKKDEHGEWKDAVKKEE